MCADVRDDIGDIALRLWTRKGQIGDLSELLRQRVNEAYSRGYRDGCGDEKNGEIDIHSGQEQFRDNRPHKFKEWFEIASTCGHCGMFNENGNHV